MAVVFDGDRKHEEFRDLLPILTLHETRTRDHRPKTKTKLSSLPVEYLKQYFKHIDSLVTESTSLDPYRSCSSMIHSRRSRCKDGDVCGTKIHMISRSIYKKLLGRKICSLFRHVPPQNFILHGAYLSEACQHATKEIIRIDLHLVESIENGQKNGEKKERKKNGSIVINTRYTCVLFACKEA